MPSSTRNRPEKSRLHQPTDASFSLPTIAEAIRSTTSTFISVGIPSDEAPVEARMLLRRACDFSQEQLLANHADELPAAASKFLENMLKRRASREPLAYILGEKEFYGRMFKVDRRVLIPRPETELLIDLCIRFTEQHHLKQPNICDIGTGSGSIPITLAHEIPNATITATDITDDALSIADENATIHGVNIRFAIEDATHPLPLTDFDIVVSNPPYIMTDMLSTLQPEVRDWEPRQALNGGHDGMDILEPLIRALPFRLRGKGPVAAFIEIDPPVAEMCLETARDTVPDAEIQIHLDHAGLERVLVVLRA